MHTIIALNIKNKEILINNYPIMFYWDVKLNESYKELFVNSNEFKTYITTKIEELGNDFYLNGKLFVCYYVADLDENTEEEINIQDLFPFEKLNQDYWVEYVYDYFVSLHDNSFKDNKINYPDKDESVILFIYNKLRQKYSNNRINRTIVTNYILSKMSDNYEYMSSKNFEYIKDRLLNILIDNE